MTERKDKDCTSRGWVACAALIAVLVAVSFIPPMTVCGVSLRRANILSEFITFHDAPKEPSAEEAPIEEVEIDMSRVAEQVAEQHRDTVCPQVPVRFEWNLAEAPAWSADEADALLAELPDAGEPAVPIEDFDTTGMSPLMDFYRKAAAGEPVRIAFLGDSFVEGDILTADLREQLQLRFGGGGAGFAPMASPLTGFRRTVKTAAKGWTSYNIMQQTKAPADLKDAFTISGWVCRPVEGASTRWEMTDARACLDSCTRAEVWFRSRRDSRVELTVNDTLKRVFDVPAGEALREVEVSNPHIHSLAFKVLSGADGVVGYGASFGGDGVTVDNYSIRSNNGQALFRTSPTLNAQLQQLAGYDLVVLQYGLNIMQQGVHSYSRYSGQIEQMITYVHECFPGAAVLLLGVSERYVKGEEGFSPMDAIPSMLRWQRQAAERTGAAFWNTCEAMRALGGMERFVEKGWAGKDYTHINYAGGRQIAGELYAALYAGVRQAWLRLCEQQVKQEEQMPVLDPLRVDSLMFRSTVEIIR